MNLIGCAGCQKFLAQKCVSGDFDQQKIKLATELPEHLSVQSSIDDEILFLTSYGGDGDKKGHR